MKENAFVAVHIEGYKKPPVIGKVIAINNDSTFDLVYWKGSWRKEWKPWETANGELWRDTLPNGCILLVDFHLDNGNKLKNETYKYLRDTYKKLETN